jgi:Rrf2 family protein
MTASSKFPVAVHLMTALAFSPKEWLTSPMLAESVGTNPVVIRRLVGQLRRAGLVEAHAGKLGGMELARRPDTITLLDIYRAVEGGSTFTVPDKPENRACAVSCGMRSILASVLAETDRAIAGSLEKVRLSDLVNEITSTAASAR